jgi:hypothetical protein
MSGKGASRGKTARRYVRRQRVAAPASAEALRALFSFTCRLRSSCIHIAD